MEQPKKDPAIELVGLTKAFGQTEVLAGIDLTVSRGEVFGYIGPNGAGKSTTVKILAGLSRGHAGTARVAGVDVRSHPLKVKQRIGYLPENAQLFEALTVEEHFLLIGRLHGLADDVTIERSQRMMAGFELTSRYRSRIESLSKGMRQKVMISSALLHDPRILFLDEPLSGLDANSTVLIKELLQSLAERGKTIFYCSHMMDVVERVCDRIAILFEGRIAALGTFDELAAQQGAGSTLERVFLELTGSGAESARVQTILAAFAPGDARAPTSE